MLSVGWVPGWPGRTQGGRSPWLNASSETEPAQGTRGHPTPQGLTSTGLRRAASALTQGCSVSILSLEHGRPVRQ